MRSWLWLFGVWMVGCAQSGAAKSAEAPSADSPPSEAEAAAEQPATHEAATKPKDNAGPATHEDVQAVLQLVIDDEALEPYLHLDRAERFPLRVAGKDLPADLELVKATKPVIWVADASSEKKPVLVFTEVTVDGDEASVRYRYDVEKIHGSASLRRRDGHWLLARSRVTEH